MPTPEAGWVETLERQAFRALNTIARPPIQRGFGSPCLTPWGLVVLEHTGRQTGRTHASPLWALRLDHRVVVATYRKTRSHWIRNLKHQPETHLWMNGERKPVRAHVLDPSQCHDADAPDSIAERIARPVLHALRALLAAGFAVSVLELT